MANFTYRVGLGRPLTYQEEDDNMRRVEELHDETEEFRDEAREALTPAFSSTNLSIGTGEKTLTIEENKSLAEGSFVKIVDLNDTDNWMYGEVTEYTGTTLKVEVSRYQGSGGSNAWTVLIAGMEGEGYVATVEGVAPDGAGNIDLGLGSAAYENIGSDPSEIPTNADLGSAAFIDAEVNPAADKIPLANDEGVIKAGWVEDLLFNHNQIYAQLWSARYPGIPAPSFYQEFGGGASLLDPRITFSRSGEATYIKNGRLLTADIDEPVFEHGGFRVWPSVTNLLPYSNSLDMWPENDGFDLEEIGADGDLLTWRALVSQPLSVARLFIRDVLPDVDGKTYTYTCYVKRAESFEGDFWVGSIYDT